jgi:hypothetical protein
MGFYKNAADDMRRLRMQVLMENIPRLTAIRAAARPTSVKPVVRQSMATKPDNGREDKGQAKGEMKDYSGESKGHQDPDKQPSSRGGGGLPPTEAPVVLLHRRGRAGANMLEDFNDERAARTYAREHKLMIVHSEKRGEQTRLFYLPE